MQDAIVAWRKKVSWAGDLQVEQDLILHAMIHAIYSNPVLAKKLGFRGGTCLNKLFWETPSRYSEDLDFVQIVGEPIGPTVRELKKALNAIFTEPPTWEAKKGSFRLYYSFVPESSPNYSQNIKIEINTREHFALEGYRKEKIRLDSVWKSGEAEVTTFSIEELLATKLRALYQRKKGRDLFDLWKSRELSPDNTRVVTLCLEYFRRMGKTLYRGHFLKNVEEKLKDPVFVRDLEPLVHPALDYDVSEAADFVRNAMLALIPESRRAGKKRRQVA